MGVLPYFLQPVAHILKAAQISHIVHKDDASCAFVISVSKWPEFDLASRVPDGHSHLGALMHDVLLLVVDTSRADKFTLKDAI